MRLTAARVRLTALIRMQHICEHMLAALALALALLTLSSHVRGREQGLQAASEGWRQRALEQAQGE